MSEEDSPNPEKLQRILDFISGAMSVVRAHQFGSEGVIFTGMLKHELDIGFDEFEAHYVGMTERMNDLIPMETDPDELHDQMHKYMRIGTEEINKHIHKIDEKKLETIKGYA